MEVCVTDFPTFQPLTLADRELLHPKLWAFQSQVSELTFGNLYIWRTYYNLSWAMADDWLILLADEPEGPCFALPPVGPGDRTAVTHKVLTWLREARGVETPMIARAGQRLADDLANDDRFVVTPTRDHFDYVYTTEDLAEMPGRKYSSKRNHINQFMRYYRFTYEAVTPELVQACLDLAEVWCEQRLCDEDLSLQHELSGIEDALTHFETLGIDGGAILVRGKVQAFALGERLNETTAVIHIEKANPEFKGIYPTMTQLYADRWQGETPYINLEQDLGEPGLLRAKESYYPDHMAEKYTITLAEANA
jgi:hypothetical protein